MSDPQSESLNVKEPRFIHFDQWAETYKNIEEALFTGKSTWHLVRQPGTRIFRNEQWPEIGLPFHTSNARGFLNSKDEERNESIDLVIAAWKSWTTVLSTRGTQDVVICTPYPSQPSKKSSGIVASKCSFNWDAINYAHMKMDCDPIIEDWHVFDCEGRWGLFCNEDGSFSIFAAPADVISEIVQGCGGLDRLQFIFNDVILDGQSYYYCLIDLIRWPAL
jgi:hypothetical protein